jgi:uncharacterized SAM-binding protein YcdF (DUF218 family)
LPVSLGCPFFVLFVFLLCLVPNIACVSGLSILCFICLRPVSCAQYCLCLWVVHSAQDTGRRQIKQRMDNPETQAILSTRHRRKTNKTKNGQPGDTGRRQIKKEWTTILCFICLRSVSCAHYCLCLWVVHSLFYLSSSSVLCPILPVSLCCPFFILFVFVLCLVNKTKNGQPRETGNIGHKTQDEDK